MFRSEMLVTDGFQILFNKHELGKYRIKTYNTDDLESLNTMTV